MTTTPRPYEVISAAEWTDMETGPSSDDLAREPGAPWVPADHGGKRYRITMEAGTPGQEPTVVQRTTAAEALATARSLQTKGQPLEILDLVTGETCFLLGRALVGTSDGRVLVPASTDPTVCLVCGTKTNRVGPSGLCRSCSSRRANLLSWSHGRRAGQRTTRRLATAEESGLAPSAVPAPGAPTAPTVPASLVARDCGPQSAVVWGRTLSESSLRFSVALTFTIPEVLALEVLAEEGHMTIAEIIAAVVQQHVRHVDAALQPARAE